MLFSNQFPRSARFSLFLVMLWAFIFPAKGALYQLALYLIPLSVFFIRDFRSQLSAYRSFLVMASVLLVLPFLLSDLWNWFDAGISPGKEPVDIFWRLVLLPVCLVIIVRFFALSPQTMVAMLIAFLLFYGLVVLGEFLMGQFIDEAYRQKRYQGLVFNPNPFGMLMGLGVLLSMFQFTQADGQGVRSGYFVLALLFLFLVLLSGSRSSLLAVVIALTLLLVMQRERFRFGGLSLVILGVVLTLGVVFFVLNPYYLDYYSKRVSGFFIDGIRIEIWQHYLSQLHDKLWLGGPIFQEDRFIKGTADYGPHSTFVELVRRTGVIGLLAFVYFSFLILSVLWKIKSAQSNLALAMLVFLYIFGAFNAQLHSNSLTQSVFAIILTFLFYALHDSQVSDRRFIAT